MPMTLETYNEMAGGAWLHKCRCDYANIVAYHEIGDVTPSELWILPRLCCLGGDVVASDHRLVQWAFFAEGLPAAKAKQPSEKTPRSASAKGITAEMLQEHPWLQAFVEKQHNKQKRRSSKDPADGKGSESGGDDGVAEAEGLGEDEVEAVFKELHEKRQTWLDTAPVATTDFKASILGGAWTKAHKAVAYDYFLGAACTTAAEQWCRRDSTGLSARFSAKLYGDEVAALLSRYWAAKMQHYYDIYVASGKTSYAYTQEDHDSWDEPSGVKDRASTLVGPAAGRLGELRALRPAQVGASR